MTTSLPHTHVRLRDLSELVAGIPYILGFPPTDSLVLFTFRRYPLLGLSATIRVDLPKPEHVPLVVADVVAAVSRNKAVAAIAVVVGDPQPEHRQLVESLRMSLADNDILLTHASWVRKVVHGEQWQCYDDPLCTSEVPDPETSALAAAVAVAGDTTYPNREAVAAHLAPDPAEALARRRELLKACHADPARPDVHEDLAMLGHVLDKAMTSYDLPTLDDHQLVRLAQALSRPEIKDACLAMVLTDEPEPAERLWTVLVRSLPAPERADPAFLLAISAYLRGAGVLAALTLRIAMESNPKHALAIALDHALQSGLPPEALKDMLTRSVINNHEVRTSSAPPDDPPWDTTPEQPDETPEPPTTARPSPTNDPGSPTPDPDNEQTMTEPRVPARPDTCGALTNGAMPAQAESCPAPELASPAAEVGSPAHSDSVDPPRSVRLPTSVASPGAQQPSITVASAPERPAGDTPATSATDETTCCDSTETPASTVQTTARDASVASAWSPGPAVGATSPESATDTAAHRDFEEASTTALSAVQETPTDVAGSPELAGAASSSTSAVGEGVCRNSEEVRPPGSIALAQEIVRKAVAATGWPLGHAVAASRASAVDTPTRHDTAEVSTAALSAVQETPTGVAGSLELAGAASSTSAVGEGVCRDPEEVRPPGSIVLAQEIVRKAVAATGWPPGRAVGTSRASAVDTSARHDTDPLLAVQETPTGVAGSLELAGAASSTSAVGEAVRPASTSMAQATDQQALAASEQSSESATGATPPTSADETARGPEQPLTGSPRVAPGALSQRAAATLGTPTRHTEVVDALTAFLPPLTERSEPG